MASISSSDRRISASKRRLKPPLLLRDYLLDDLSSCSSNGFKSFPRRQSSSSNIRLLLLDAEIRRSRFHQKRRLSRTRTTCGTALGHVVQKASTAFVNAVKMLPFPSSVKPPTSPTVRTKSVGLSRSFSKRLLSRTFWRSSDRRRDSGEATAGGRVEPDRDAGIQRSRSFAEFLQERLDQPSDQISVAVVVVDHHEEVSGESSSSLSRDSSEVVQSSSSMWSGESEASNENDGAEGVVVVVVGERVEGHVGDGGSVTAEDNRKECVVDSEEKEQFSPVSVLENPFEDENDDDANDLTSPSNQDEANVKLGTRSRRFVGLVRIEPVDLEKRIERYTENDKNQASNQTRDSIIITEGDDNVVEGENRANHLFARLKSRTDGPNTRLLIDASANLLLDFLQEDGKEGTEEETLVKTAEEWVLGRQEEMFLSWEVKEKREVYVKEMERREKWGCLREERECVLEGLGDGFFTALLDELLLDLSSSF